MTHSAGHTRPFTPEEIIQAVQGMPVTSSLGAAVPLPEEGWQRVSKRLDRPAVRRVLTRPRWNLGAIVAASVLVVGVVGGVWWQTRSASDGETRSYRTARAEQSSVQLPDGSYAVLAPATRLTYHSDARGNRTVTLDGQAYFAVQHDPSRPFAVRANDVLARVLGTAFTVRAYPNDTKLQVAVSEGKVFVGVSADSAVLLPGDVGYVTTDRKIAISKHEKIADMFGWMRGEVAFRDAPVQDVVAELERRYDVSVTIADRDLAKKPVTIVFSGESVRTLVTSIALASGANVTWINDRTMTLSPAR